MRKQVTIRELQHNGRHVLVQDDGGNYHILSGFTRPKNPVVGERITIEYQAVPHMGLWFPVEDVETEETEETEEFAELPVFTWENLMKGEDSLVDQYCPSCQDRIDDIAPAVIGRLS